MNYRLVFNKITKKYEIFNVTSKRVVVGFESGSKANAYLNIVNKVRRSL